MAYVAGDLIIASWTSPVTITESDLISGLDDAVNDLVTNNANSLKNHVNTELGKIPTYLKTEAEAIAAAVSDSANSAEDSNLESQDWANKIGGVVNTYIDGVEQADGTEYSAKKYAQDAAVSAASVDADNIIHKNGSGLPNEGYDKVEIEERLSTKISTVASSVLLNPTSLTMESWLETVGFATVSYTGQNASATLTDNADTTWNIVNSMNTTDFTVDDNTNCPTLTTCKDSASYVGQKIFHDRSVTPSVIKICTGETNAGVTITGAWTADWGTNKGIADVHIKNRDAADVHQRFDGLRGATKYLDTSNTTIETADVDTLISFNNGSVTIGQDVKVNTLNEKYVAYFTLYTHLSGGKTNQGKLYIEAFNPIIKQGIELYRGSGLAGHSLPHSMGVKLDYWDIKNLENGVINWITQTSYHEDGYLSLNLPNAFTPSTSYAVTNDTNVLTLNANTNTNTADEEHIMYYKCKSENWTIVLFQGTVAGNFIETKDVNGVPRKLRRFTIKAISASNDYMTGDTNRGDNKYIRFNTSAIEDISYSFTVTSNGITINDTSAVHNGSGVQYILIGEFDTKAVAGSPDDGYFNFPVDDANLTLTNAEFNYCEGKDETGYKLTSEAVATRQLDFANVSDGFKWVNKLKGSTGSIVKEFPDMTGDFVAFDYKPSYGLYDKKFADDNRLVFNKDDGKWYSTADANAFTEDFSTDLSAWTIGGTTTPSISSGQCLLTGADGYIEKVHTASAGDRISVDFTWSTGTLVVTDGTTSKTFTGSDTFEFVAQTDNPTITFTATATGYLDDIEIYKKEATLDTALTTPISLITHPVMINSNTAQYIDYNQKVSENFMAYPELYKPKIQGNRVIKEIGTIYNNNRYKIDHRYFFPDYSGNAEDYEAKIEIYHSAIDEWAETASVSSTSGVSTVNAYVGVEVASLKEGVCVRTASTYLAVDSSTYGGTSSDGSVIASAPARVILTYVGATK
ncbi:hypothetical protein [Sulfurimonas sp.]|uniref:DUF7483 domain-containing protein n=1 Tax=Sulfurimonas sp. TaxID=2022749 RepID=UPI00356A7E9E